MKIELRSDTFTKPSIEMLEAMFTAQVGDDVFEEDSTTIALEKKTAALFGYEAGLFCVSGTMANQIAIKCHTQPGEEVICDALSHIYLYEGGGISTNSLASVHLLNGNRGRINATQIEEIIKIDNVHFPISTLVSLENTMNKGGGCYYSIQEIEKIKNVCKANKMSLHLDGARIFNALVETRESPLEYGSLFDSISVCLSKGLGTPMGSVLLGSKNFIKSARRIRKRLGGGWRQSGYMAAAGIFALDNNIYRLKDDHKRAKELATIFSTLPQVIDLYPTDTNIVIFEINHELLATNFVHNFAQKGIYISAFGKHQIRLVTHLDFGDLELEMCEGIVSKMK